jgi:hypothetical protein
MGRFFFFFSEASQVRCRAGDVARLLRGLSRVPLFGNGDDDIFQKRCILFVQEKSVGAFCFSCAVDEASYSAIRAFSSPSSLMLPCAKNLRRRVSQCRT